MTPKLPKNVFFLHIGDYLIICLHFDSLSFQTLLINYPPHLVRQPVRNFLCQTLKISKVSLVVMGS
jgi:hypothetical protein